MAPARTRSRSKTPKKKTTPNKKKSKDAASASSGDEDMPVDAKLALTIVRWYAAAFFVGMCIFTDQLAKGYGIEVTDTNKIFMVFAGLNGMFFLSATNAFVARIGHKKTMSLTCFANMVAFAGMGLWQIKGEFVDQPSASSQLGMDSKMQYFNIAQQVVLVAVSYMGWVSSGSAMPTVPSFDKLSDMNQFNWVTVGTCTFFGVMSFFATDTLLKMYKVTMDGNSGSFMNNELMKFMGMLLMGNAFRLVCVIQGGDKTTAYSNVRAGLMYYFMVLGMMMFQPWAARSMGISAEENMGPRVVDFIRNFGCIMWGVSVMTKND